MMEHLPGKSAKQIRDKRKKPSYKALIDEANTTKGLHEDGDEFSDESVNRQQTLEHCPTQAEDGGQTESKKVTRRLTSEISENRGNDPDRRCPSDTRTMPEPSSSTDGMVPIIQGEINDEI
jgi:hypothetical protein